MMDKTRREHILRKLRDGRTLAKKIEPKISSISSKKQVCSYTTVRHVALTVFPFSSIKMKPSHPLIGGGYLGQEPLNTIIVIAELLLQR